MPSLVKAENVSRECVILVVKRAISETSFGLPMLHILNPLTVLPLLLAALMRLSIEFTPLLLEHFQPFAQLHVHLARIHFVVLAIEFVLEDPFEELPRRCGRTVVRDLDHGAGIAALERGACLAAGIAAARQIDIRRFPRIAAAHATHGGDLGASRRAVLLPTLAQFLGAQQPEDQQPER
jgi:hypothetical protein